MTSIQLELPPDRRLETIRDVMRCVFNNIRELAKNDPDTLRNLECWDELQKQTMKLIEDMERLPLRSLRASFRRRRRRQLLKKRRKRERERLANILQNRHLETEERESQMPNAASTSNGTGESKETSSDTSKSKQQSTGRTCKTGGDILVLLEQLEQLVAARVRDSAAVFEISQKLTDIRGIWEKVTKDYKDTRNNRPQNCILDWYELLFGESLHSLSAQQAIPKLKQFVWKRLVVGDPPPFALL